MNVYQQESPFAVQIEPVEGCNLACGFCALQILRNNGADWTRGKHGTNSGPFKYMEIATLKHIVGEMAVHKWTSRIELAMHGEPTLHDDIVAFVRVIRRHLPNNQIMITSNGGGLLKTARIYDLFLAGLDILALDDYKHSGLIERVLAPIRAENADVKAHFGALGIKFRHYPRDEDGSPHRRLKRGEKLFTIISDIADNVEGTHVLTNQGGFAGVRSNERSKQRCAKPFRELSFRWDGSVAICCDDWPGTYKIGNINDMGLMEIWHHPRFEAARRELYHHGRTFGPCEGCNVKSYRVGLLPDKKGKDVMAEPTGFSRGHINEALAGTPLTPFKLKV